jgi:N utilization substance protein A
MDREVLEIIDRIGNERNINIDILVEALEAALVSASKKMLGNDVKVSRAEIDRETASFRVYAYKMVVDAVEFPEDEILVEEAQRIAPGCQVGESIEVDVTPADFGRIAAQSAKQVVTQRIREAERVMVYEKFKDRVGELIYGTVHRYEKRDVIVDLGVTEGILKQNEKAYGERYRYGDKIRAYIMAVQESSKEPQVVLSRRCPEFLVKLFQNEVPEIAEGIVSIKAVAREAGRRSKIAVASSDPSVDPVGACVGVKGSRVQMVVQELRGERIDIVEYSDDPRRFVANALKPAEVSRVDLIEDENGKPERATLVVRDDQLSLAIGKGGLNANLAAKLTGVPIDIVSEAELTESEEAMREELLILDEVDDLLADALMSEGLFSVEDIVQAGKETLMDVPGMTEEKADAILSNAEELLQLADQVEEELMQGESQEEAEAAISVEQVGAFPGDVDLPSPGPSETEKGDTAER